MKYSLVLFFVLLAACNSVTVVPIDDEDAGDEAGASDAGADG
jgi:hypothetical protein